MAYDNRAGPASAIILAGGRSTRMGVAKAALGFGEVTLLERIVVELIPAFDEIVVVAAPIGHESFGVAETLQRFGGQVKLVRDGAAFAGPAPALVEGLRAIRHAIAFVCSCDLPLLRVSVAQALTAVIGGCDAVIPQVAGRAQPLCAAYRRSSAELMDSALQQGESSLTAITRRLNTRRVDGEDLRGSDPELLSFVNVNTPEDYARALRLAGIDRGACPR
jgi:molybdopterin-guanine dinucleotide biosynthesis protein A